MPLDLLFKKSDIISIHAPLNKFTTYLIDEKSISMMKDGVMLINTSRGKIVDTQAVVNALTSGKIGYLGLDVYENEKGIFSEDFKGKIFNDKLLKELMAFPNVLITAHQAFLTNEALNYNPNYENSSLWFT
jgi:D-lactate dehydrogenase